MFGYEDDKNQQADEEGHEDSEADDGGEAADGAGTSASDAAIALEARARELGWSPKDKWKGDPKAWIDAKSFVRRGEEILPILRANNRKQEDRLAIQDGQIRELQNKLTAANEQLEVLTDMSTEQSRKDAKARRRELISARITARKDGDADLEAQLDEQIEDQTAAIAGHDTDDDDDAGVTARDKNKGKKKAKNGGGNEPASDPMQNPAFRAWAQENTWFGVDIRKTQFAIAVAQELRQSTEGKALQGKAFFDKVGEEVETFFARGTPKGRAASKVGAGGGGNGRGGSGGNGGGGSDEGGDGKDFSDLPNDAQEVCKRQATRMVGKDRKFKTIAEWQKFYTKSYFAQG